MKKIKIGVLGGYRGTGMINFCKFYDGAEVVAICDKSEEVLKRQEESCKGLGVTFYSDFDDFINHDMDAVVLANYANEHAPFAIRALNKGLHVFSEVLPCQTMKEAVELIETVEKSGKIYAYGENYCYMLAPYEMTKLYRQNKIGEIEYAECEYAHNCDKIWPSIAYGDPDHWRNNMYATFYCTHSLGPIIHATGLRPVSVVGWEIQDHGRSEGHGAKHAGAGLEIVTLENGAIVRSLHGGLYKSSKWYKIDGSKGRMESAREDTNLGDVDRIYINYDEKERAYKTKKVETYIPEVDEKVKSFGHSGSDFFSMYHFVEKIKGNKDADIIDVYEAMDMFLPGLFAFRSILKGGIPMEIPNLRDKKERDKWRNDVACTDPKVAGDQLLPCRKGGNPKIDPAVYEEQKRLYYEDLKSDTGYAHMAFNQSSVKK